MVGVLSYFAGLCLVQVEFQSLLKAWDKYLCLSTVNSCTVILWRFCEISLLLYGLFFTVWSYFEERPLPNESIVPSALCFRRILERFLFFIGLVKSHQWILAPFESKAIFGQRLADNNCHSYFTSSQLSHWNTDFQSNVILFRILKPFDSFINIIYSIF